MCLPLDISYWRVRWFSLSHLNLPICTLVSSFSPSSEEWVTSPGNTLTSKINGPIRKLKTSIWCRIWSLKRLCSSGQKGIGPCFSSINKKKLTVSFNSYTYIFSRITYMIIFLSLFFLFIMLSWTLLLWRYFRSKDGDVFCSCRFFVWLEQWLIDSSFPAFNVFFYAHKTLICLITQKLPNTRLFACDFVNAQVELTRSLQLLWNLFCLKCFRLLAYFNKVNFLANVPIFVLSLFIGSCSG